MLAVAPYRPDSDGRPVLVELPEPVPGPDEVLIAVKASALNHADLLQLRGLYPPPPGESEIPGLECAGTIEALGPGVDPAGPWRLGARVMALLAGGGHAEKVAVPTGQLMAIPDELSFPEAAALPEAALTGWTNLVAEGKLHTGETVVVTGANGGMGSFAIQIARELGARVIAAGRDRDRLARLRDQGFTVATEDDLPAVVAERTAGRGVPLVIDFVGGPRLTERLDLLADKGRLVLVGLTAGARVELDLRPLLRRRLRLKGSVLRARSREEKARLVAGFSAFGLHLLAERRLRPVIDQVVALPRIAEAYAALARGGVAGKIVVEMTR